MGSKSELAELMLKSGDLGGKSVGNAMREIIGTDKFIHDPITQIIVNTVKENITTANMETDLDHAIEQLMRARSALRVFQAEQPWNCGMDREVPDDWEPGQFKN